MQLSEVKMPKIMDFLFQPIRYKVAYGGRGSGKSWAFARALLVIGSQRPLRVLCTREVQKSIKDSVHKLLSDQILKMGLSAFYSITDISIKGANGTEFFFSGLASHTVDSVKSFEGIDVCWVEEGQTITKKSWDILIPTIRKEDSEIWVSFNPDLDTDETYTRFVVNPPDNAIVRQVNYNDNKYFPLTLEQERKHCELTRSKDEYENIWLGKCKTSIDGAIYAQEVSQWHADGNVCNVPYDPRIKVHTVWDLGWNDSMSIILCQKQRSEIRVLEYIEDSHKTLDYYAGILNAKPLNWGYDFLPHDGFYGDYKTGRSAEEILKSFGRKVKETPNMPVETGIKICRSVLPQCYLDKTYTTRLLECLKRYRRAINQKTNTPGEPLHDEYSHGADAMRYLAINVESMRNDAERQRTVSPRPKPIDPGAGY